MINNLLINTHNDVLFGPFVVDGQFGHGYKSQISYKVMWLIIRTLVKNQSKHSSHLNKELYKNKISFPAIAVL